MGPKGKKNDGKLSVAVMLAQLAAVAVRLVLAFWPGCDDWPHSF